MGQIVRDVVWQVYQCAISIRVAVTGAQQLVSVDFHINAVYSCMMELRLLVHAERKHCLPRQLSPCFKNRHFAHCMEIR